MINFRPHSDEPIPDDLPHLQILSTQVADVVAQCETPQVFGVSGEWGSGKTSFLCGIEKKLSGKCHLTPNAKAENIPLKYQNVKVVWFEAWRYQHEPAPVAALLHEICSQLSTIEKLKKSSRKFVYAGVQGLINSLKEVNVEGSIGIIKTGVKISNPITKFQDGIDKWNDDNISNSLTSQKLRKLLSEAIDALLHAEEHQKSRVVVIVDDLDRCEPSTAFRILEAIKIYLNIERCVFILGINHREVAKLVGNALPVSGNISNDESLENHRRGCEYLEKLCSVVWHLPIMRSQFLKNWLSSLLRPTKASKALDAHPLSPSLTDRICDLCEEYQLLPSNPRKIKAWSNTLRNLASLAYPQPQKPGKPININDEEAEFLCISSCLMTFHPQLVTFLQGHASMFDKLIEFANGKIPNTSNTKYGLFREIILPLSSESDESEESSLANPTHGHVFRVRFILKSEASKNRSQLYEKLLPYLNLPDRKI